ncbi:MAG: class I SAM-dependent methyltransferase [Lachnospiraceae bacterium]
MYNEKDIIAQWNADMYELNETDVEDVEFAIKLMGTTPKKVLEIACGSGRFLVPMAKAGHDVTGLDFDAYMLEKIAHKITNEKIRWRKADVICDHWGTDFDVVILGANFLYNIVTDRNYEQSQKMLIQKSADALAVGGHIFVDCGYTQYPEKWFNNPEANIVWEGTDRHGNFGKMILRNSVYDAESRINRFIRRFEMILADGSTLVEEIPSEKHFASLEQIQKWLDEAGFVIEQACGDYQGHRISEITNRAVIWARKVK